MLIGGALLFWGWENGLLLWAALMTAALEGARFTRARWELSNTDLNRISDLCLVLFLGAGLVLYSTEDRLVFIFKFSQWLPFCFFPLILAQAYGNRPAMPLSVLSPLLRRPQAGPMARRSYNISFCYFALCLMASSASVQPNRFFYPGIALLVAFALTSVRPRRVAVPVWIILLAASAAAGHFSHQGLKNLQTSMEGILGNWMADFFRQPQDTRECKTQIGHPGLIRQSGKIALRLRAEPGELTPSLLREATWDEYRTTTWWASSNDFSAVHFGGSDSFRLLAAKTISSQVEIARYFDEGEGPLVLPQGTFEISDVPASVRTNRLGMAIIEGGPGLVDLKASYGPGASLDSPPCALDRSVPDVEKPVLSNVLASLHLEGLSERKKIAAIGRFFASQFTYSLRIPPHDPNDAFSTALGYFLTTTHSGHCEYFGTATVLLLRQAGISARYITGYAVMESARHGDTYLVRARHAHAWALVYHTDTGNWGEIDNTPSGWDGAEAAKPPWWEPISDTFSNLYFQFSKWRWSKTSWARYTSWLLVPLILYLTWRIVSTQRRQRPGEGAEDSSGAREWPGLDSELYQINRQLSAADLSLLPNEPLGSWQQRLETAFPDSDRLRRIFHLHRSLRFDPRGLKKGERETLRREAQQWLEDFAARTAGAENHSAT